MILQKQEDFALKLSIVGTSGMSFLGIIFGLIAPSEAILLDGFFNVISLLMAGVSLWVSWLLKQPESEDFQFGYALFEPLVNLGKGLLIGMLSLFALFSSIVALLNGGRSLNAEIGIIYAAIAATGCLIIAFIQRNIAKKNNSPMVQVDSQNWLINGTISLSVGIAFIIVSFIEKTSWSGFVPYADPTLVTVLVSITLPVPIKIIIESLNQLLLGSPSLVVRQQIRTVIRESIQDLPCVKYWLRITKMGRQLYVHIYWLLPANFQINSVYQLDQIREQIAVVLQQSYNNLALDIIFTQDKKWAEPPHGSEIVVNLDRL